MTLRALLLAALLVPAACFAGDDDQIQNGAPVAIRPDMAYMLVRTAPKDGMFPIDVVFVRAVSPAEIEAARGQFDKDGNFAGEPNIVQMNQALPYTEADPESVYLMAVKPGTYIVAEQAYGGAHGRAASGACMCMGTVKFEAKPGAITDLGYVVAAKDDRPTNVPELTREVWGKETNLGRLPVIMTMRPYADGMPLPGQLKGLPRVAADYHAAGPFPNYFSFTISRLAPVPGVLDYDKDGHVIDLKTAPHK